MTAIDDVHAAVRRGPSRLISGVISQTGPDRSVNDAMTRVVSHTVAPLLIGPTPLRVWRFGAKYRVETEAGELVAVSDGVDVWQGPTPARGAITASATELDFTGSGRCLLVVPVPVELDEATLRDVLLLDRNCWSIESLSDSQRERIELTIDKQSKAIIREYHPLTGASVSYASVHLADADTDAFVIPGSAAGGEYRRLQGARERREDRDAVTARLNADLGDKLRLDGVSFSVAAVIESADDGFEVVIAGGEVTGRLARRRHRDTEWHVSFSNPAQAWSTPAHDWVIALDGAVVNPKSLSDLRNRLHPGEPVIGQPEITPPAATT